MKNLFRPTKNAFKLLPKRENGASEKFIHAELKWIDYLCPSHDYFDFFDYRQPIADFTSLINNEIFVFDIEAISKYAETLGLLNPYVLDYKSYIPEIIDYECYYFPSPFEFREIHITEDEEYFTETQMRELIIQKLVTLSRSNLNLTMEIADFYLNTIQETKSILNIICSEWTDEYSRYELLESERSFLELNKQLNKRHNSLKHVKLEFTQVDIETEKERSNAAAKCRQLEILGLDKILKSAFKNADNPAASIANFLLSFRSIKPVTLKTQLHGTISNYSGSNSNARNVSQNFKEKDFDYLRSIGIDRSIISKYKTNHNP
ncbi:hypothetical protein AAU57_14050 [Nonlabens sp. YIK11]|uniref:hypothetical protein n=1 Tax=Nonlabens sp. YIK11 TaxID=1453349 RepID=UPI0006DCB548|nr:hypothetical protein [Nonlabens sp. YIK11]KQC34336.1 hypothetical protein AAU57_14050 [Nonlabens sp. YIK11]